MGKRRKNGTHLLQAQQALGNLLGGTNWEREKKVSLAADAGLSFRGIYDQRTMTNEGAKRYVQHLVPSACCVCSRCRTFLFVPSLAIVL